MLALIFSAAPCIAALLVLLIYLNRNDINVEPPRPRGIKRWY